MSHRRPLRGTVQTGPAPHVLPWQVEWAVGQSFKCHIGRVHDEDAINNDSEFSQSRFSANQQQRISISTHRMTSATLNRNVTSMEKSVHSVPVKTGSSLIYVKTSRGRITTPSTSVDETLGYATWGESIVRSSSHDTYFVLHKVRDDTDSYDQWCLSVINDSDVVESDIKIACFKYARGGSASRANLIQLWKSDIMVFTPPVFEECSFPFKISLDKDTGDFTVAGGSVGFGLCQGISGSGACYVNLTANLTPQGASGGSLSTSSSPPDFNSQGNLCVGLISGSEQSGFTVNQYVTTSLWVERFQCGASGPVEIYWNSV